MKPIILKEGNGALGGRTPTEEEKRIMRQVEQLMTEQRIYREPGLSLDKMALRLKVRRNLLSSTINNCTGSNFTQYINSHRVREAMELLRTKAHSQLYIDELYERVGFCNRTSFYRVFTQATGVPPLEYQQLYAKHQLEPEPDTCPA